MHNHDICYLGKEYDGLSVNDLGRMLIVASQMQRTISPGKSKMVKKLITVFYLIFVLVGGPNKTYSMDSLQDKYLSSDLPAIIIAYSIYCSRHKEFKSLESGSQNVLLKLGKNIDALKVGLSTGLAFTHQTFIVQNNIEGHLSGFVRIKGKTLEESKVPFESILFVTTPIESFGDRVLLILSSVSPEQTTIVSIDNRLHAELLYDSFKKNEIKNIKDIHGSDFIGSIYGIRVETPGVFLLQERMMPAGRGFVSPYENRVFVIDVTNGTFEIAMKAIKSEEGKHSNIQ